MRLFSGIVYKIFFMAAALIGIFLFFADFADLRFNTADGSIYLNIAENIFNHKGFVVSYNLCQCFNGLYHPIWAYYQPLYPVFASLFIGHGGIAEVIWVNILLFALSMILIMYIVHRLMPNWLNILFFIFLTFSFNCYICAVYPWSEELHLFCFIITFILFLKFKEKSGALFGLGIVNGVLMLVRVAHMYNFLAYIPVIFIGKGNLAQKIKRACFFVGGFILFYGLYQLFCFLTYHTFYPSYARPGANYGIVRFVSGIVYDPAKVGLQVSMGSMFTRQHVMYIAQHLRDFYKQMPYFLWPALFYFVLPEDKKVKGGLIELCFFQSIFTVIGYSLTFYWLTYSFDALRYSLIPYIMISIVGWYCMYEGLSLASSLGRLLIGLVVMSCLFVSPQVDRFFSFEKHAFKHPRQEYPYYRNLYASYQWINKNLPQEILVASDEDQEGYFMHRPFISTPLGASYNCSNLILYNRIYSPDYYLLTSFHSDKCFASIAHSTIYTNEIFRVLEVNKKRT